MSQSLGVFEGLSTALMFDASVRLGLLARVAPLGLHALINGSRVAGRVLPARHYGSVDVFLEAISNSRKGDVLVIDNGGKTSEACIGDLVTLEAKASGLAGIVVWGCHRDTVELRRIRLPVFSLGQCPSAPTRVLTRPNDALESARFGDFRISREDVVFGDDDGLLFFSSKNLTSLVATARKIGETERRQAIAVKKGKTLRDQLHFKEYLAKRHLDSSYTFRKHLRASGGAVEE